MYNIIYKLFHKTYIIIYIYIYNIINQSIELWQYNNSILKKNLVKTLMHP